MFLRQADFFLQFTKHGLFDRLTLAHAALRKLPAATAGALTQKYLAVVAHQDDADIGSIPLGVDPVAHDARFTGSQPAEQGARFCGTMRREFLVPLPPCDSPHWWFLPWPSPV